MMTRDDLLDDTAAASPTGVEVNDPERVRRLIAEHRRTHGPAASSAPRPAAAAGAGAGDVTAMIFWLKNRRPDKWRDKPERVETGEGVRIVDDY